MLHWIRSTVLWRKDTHVSLPNSIVVRLHFVGLSNRKKHHDFVAFCCRSQLVFVWNRMGRYVNLECIWTALRLEERFPFWLIERGAKIYISGRWEISCMCMTSYLVVLMIDNIVNEWAHRVASLRFCWISSSDDLVLVWQAYDWTYHAHCGCTCYAL